jgi:hypothetical protein
MRRWELNEALLWAAHHRNRLLPEDSSSFEFQLHTLLYMRTLSGQGVNLACPF